MKKYIVKQSEYKPLEGKEIALQPVGDNTTTSDGGRYNDVKKPRKSKAPGWFSEWVETQFKPLVNRVTALEN